MHYEIFLHENKSAADFLLSILAHVTDDKNIEYWKLYKIMKTKRLFMNRCSFIFFDWLQEIMFIDNDFSDIILGVFNKWMTDCSIMPS